MSLGVRLIASIILREFIFPFSSEIEAYSHKANAAGFDRRTLRVFKLISKASISLGLNELNLPDANNSQRVWFLHSIFKKRYVFIDSI